jgi:type II secretory ATPase GspE/PulE/Tfp pilus assembly ATPase PilB-like protein
VLRQDPDVVLVGEMRDRETADIAIRAAMTGHMVFSTLHTNNALGAIPRLIDLGIEPYLVSATIEGILAQRLVRRICRDCTTTYQPDAQLVAALAERPVSRPELFRGAGCDTCRSSRFRGRVGVFEFLIFDDEIKQLIARGGRLPELRSAARKQGMITLREDAWTKVQAGLTTVEEVLRVVAA